MQRFFLLLMLASAAAFVPAPAFRKMSSLSSSLTDPPAFDPSADVLLGSSDLDVASSPGSSSDAVSPPSQAHKAAMKATRDKYARSDNDTGSPEYQVASMTTRILYLTSHLQSNPSDFSTRRGLVALVNKRRRLLNYLFAEDVDRYKDLVASLGVRHKAPGRVMGREEKYAKFATKKKS
mmetsp:Transcript_12041/g.24447  ORF Transcript_12041/g.24447 Transcript_12041/m.24447 type:complete len:179 (+) Transcript_12041:56-592(+)